MRHLIVCLIAIAAVTGCTAEVEPEPERGATVLPDADVTIDASFAEYRAPVPLTGDRTVTASAPAAELLDAEPDLRVRFTKDSEDYQLTIRGAGDLCYLHSGFAGFCEIVWIDDAWVRSAWGEQAW